jgi:hypothetical protein
VFMYDKKCFNSRPQKFLIKTQAMQATNTSDTSQKHICSPLFDILPQTAPCCTTQTGPSFAHESVCRQAASHRQLVRQTDVQIRQPATQNVAPNTYVIRHEMRLDGHNFCELKQMQERPISKLYPVFRRLKEQKHVHSFPRDVCTGCH